MISGDGLLEGLTPEQREAVVYGDGPLLIIAGAGSGKTRVLTRRVAYLMHQGVPPGAILAITFTNKAAGEMKQRVGDLLGWPLRDFGRFEARQPTICTFHSLCLRILRIYGVQFGVSVDGRAAITVYDAGDQTKLIKEATKLAELSATNFPAGQVAAAISGAKNRLMTPADFRASVTDFYGRQVAKVYEKYQALLAQNNAVDFDDLLMRTALGFKARPDVLAELQERFTHLLIDEYQDTNHAQYMIAHLLASKRRNICVVGDPDQSIYAWRGADIQNILDFETDYADAKVVKLERNYRSTQTILAIASGLISRNTRRKDKALWTENEPGAQAELLLCQDEHDEARAVADRLKELHETESIAWGQTAVFYRMNSLSRVMEDALRRANIPYVMARGTEFYSRKEIKDVLAYLRVIANPADEVSLDRIANVPARGLSDTSLRQIGVWATTHGVTLSDALGRAGEVAGLGARAVTAAGKFAALLAEWRGMAGDSAEPPEGAGPAEIGELWAAGVVEATKAVATGKGPVTRLMEDVVRRSGLEAMLLKERAANPTAENDPLANVNELINAAAEYDLETPEGSLDDYLNRVALVSDVERLEGEGDEGGAVTMMTLHAAKGLEFAVVAMIGLEEGVLPHARARTDPDQMEEERRLCFVGITRARRRLILSKAQHRTIRGLRERTATSPFLAEMPADRLTVTDRTAVGPGSMGPPRGMPEIRTTAGWARGQLVRHPLFGLGRIAELSDMGRTTRAVIDFTTAGRKTLVVEYAKLEPVAG